ncbi:MAG: toll/interleukin-1 receptor domain-containing protein [bacterium]|nr:toll/interleukin-1 receptor domain-containing protein [bacterium]
MAEIFLSWGKPDEAAVMALVDQLRGLGLELFEYSADMPGGADISDEVMDQIDLARVVVICFSDATADREWIKTEVDWAYKTRHNYGKLEILPVWVGPHPEGRRPHLLEESVVDLHGGGSAQYRKLVERIYELLDRPPPIVVPADRTHPGSVGAVDARARPWARPGA